MSTHAQPGRPLDSGLSSFEAAAAAATTAAGAWLVELVAVVPGAVVVSITVVDDVGPATVSVRVVVVADSVLVTVVVRGGEVVVVVEEEDDAAAALARFVVVEMVADFVCDVAVGVLDRVWVRGVSALVASACPSVVVARELVGTLVVRLCVWVKLPLTLLVRLG